MINFYSQITARSTIVTDLEEFIQANRHLESWAPMALKHPDWSANIVLPQDLILRDPFLLWLYQREHFSGGILRLAPWTTYPWHQDYLRGCTINLLLSDPNLSCLLFKHSPSEQIHRMAKIVPVPYTPHYYMCLNTQVEHSVLNWGEERFVFSVHFTRELGEFKYVDLLKLVREYNLGS